VFDPAEVSAYEPEITAMVEDTNRSNVPLGQRSTALQRAFLRAPNVWQRSDAAREFVFAKRLARIAAELLGVSSVRLYHDQALYKEPGGGVTPWHIDQFAWPLPSGSACTMWIPLREIPLEMGRSPSSSAVTDPTSSVVTYRPATSPTRCSAPRSRPQRLSVAAEPFHLGR